MVAEREITEAELEEEIKKMKGHIEAFEKEQKLLKFDLKEMEDINKQLSDEIDRLYQNIKYLDDTRPDEE